jgi:acetoin utilization protein AcuB
LRIEMLMKMPVHTVKPHDSVAHARALLEENRINQLPVTVNRRLVGIVTDRDLRDASAAVQIAATTSERASAPANPERIPVDAVMTTNVLTLTPADTVEDAARLMRRERIGAVPILEREALVGIITRSDILDAFIGAGAAPEKGSSNHGSR